MESGTRKLLVPGSQEWEFEEQVSDNGNLANKYYFRGAPAVRVSLTGHIARQIAGYSLIEKDLRNLTWGLQQIETLMRKVLKGDLKLEKSIKTPGSRDDANLLKLLLVASLSLYGKLFTAAKGRSVKLEREHIKKELRDDHDSLMEMRHNFASHSGELKHEAVDVILLLDPDEKRNANCTVSTELKQPDALDHSGVAAFQKIVLGLHEDVRKKLDLLNVKILKEEIAPKGPQYWHLVAKLRK